MCDSCYNPRCQMRCPPSCCMTMCCKSRHYQMGCKSNPCCPSPAYCFNTCCIPCCPPLSSDSSCSLSTDACPVSTSELSSTESCFEPTTSTTDSDLCDSSESSSSSASLPTTICRLISEKKKIHKLERKIRHCYGRAKKLVDNQCG